MAMNDIEWYTINEMYCLSNIQSRHLSVMFSEHTNFELKTVVAKRIISIYVNLGYL